MKLTDRLIAFSVASGFSHLEISEALTLPEETIRLKCTSKELKCEIEELRSKLEEANAKDIIHSTLPKALKLLADTLDDPSAKPSTKVQVAQDFVDRGLGKPKQAMEIEGSFIRALFERLDSMKNVTPVIDVVGTEIHEEPPNPNSGPTPPKVLGNPNKEIDPVKSWIDKHIGG